MSDLPHRNVLWAESLSIRPASRLVTMTRHDDGQAGSKVRCTGRTEI